MRQWNTSIILMKHLCIYLRPRQILQRASSVKLFLNENFQLQRMCISPLSNKLIIFQRISLWYFCFSLSMSNIIWQCSHSITFPTILLSLFFYILIHMHMCDWVHASIHGCCMDVCVCVKCRFHKWGWEDMYNIL